MYIIVANIFHNLALIALQKYNQPWLFEGIVVASCIMASKMKPQQCVTRQPVNLPGRDAQILTLY